MSPICPKDNKLNDENQTEPEIVTKIFMRTEVITSVVQSHYWVQVSTYSRNVDQVEEQNLQFWWKTRQIKLGFLGHFRFLVKWTIKCKFSSKLIKIHSYLLKSINDLNWFIKPSILAGLETTSQEQFSALLLWFWAFVIQVQAQAGTLKSCESHLHSLSPFWNEFLARQPSNTN